MATRSGIHRYALAAVFVVGFAGLSHFWSGTPLAAGESLLGGTVTSSAGQPVAGVPVRAHRADSNITVNVYTNGQGNYSFPEWSDLAPGSYRARHRASRFRASHARHRGVFRQNRAGRLRPAVASAVTCRRDCIGHRCRAAGHRRAEASALSNATTATPCSSPCGPGARRKGGRRSSGAWRGNEPSHAKRPGTRAFGQKKYVEPLAEYLASIRGPGSSPDLPFRLRAQADRRRVHSACHHRIRRPAKRAPRPEHHSRRPPVCLAARHPAGSQGTVCLLHGSLQLQSRTARQANRRGKGVPLLPCCRAWAGKAWGSSPRDSCARGIRAAVHMTWPSIPRAM